MSTPPAIQTTTVGSYPVPDWLQALPSEQALVDATRVVFDTQRQAGIDLPTDGELYRFDINHPDTNGMIEYFVRPMGGTRAEFGRREAEEFAAKQSMGFRAKPAAVVEAELSAGSLDLLADCTRAAAVAGGPFKFTLTSPYMLARTLLDHHYGDFAALLMAVAHVLADQVRGLPCACVQIDEANIPGNPADGPLAARAINAVLDSIDARHPKGRPLLLWQLRRPDHPAGRVARPDRLSQRTARRSLGARTRPPPGERPEAPCDKSTRASASASA